MSSNVAIASCEFGQKVMKALGLEGQLVRTIDIHIPYNDVVTVNISMMKKVEGSEELLEVLHHYKLEKKEDQGAGQ